MAQPDSSLSNDTTSTIQHANTKNLDAGHNVEALSDTQAVAPVMETEYPEGGREAWLVVLGGWFGLFCTFGLVTCVGVFLEYYQTGPLAEYSPSTISWITSLQVFFQVGGSAVVSHFFDLICTRRQNADTEMSYSGVVSMIHMVLDGSSSSELLYTASVL
jgi:hypothetical protein